MMHGQKNIKIGLAVSSQKVCNCLLPYTLHTVLSFISFHST